ncbi:MAG TPA: DUF1501 domain-containing protein [Terriglobales bacterium]|nr:DUF1501 domain-containing protein [Terriglobales bacterium]
MPTTRRVFLKNSALAMVGIGVLPRWLARSAYASEVGGRKKILVAIFQRGAADGLNVVVPYGEQVYYKLRPSIAIPRSSVIDLDGFFGFHPSLASLKPLWDQGHLAAIQATGSPDPTRSHFDAQDFMESGTPGLKSTDDGWLNRAIGLDPSAGTSPWRAVSMTAQVPMTLQGRVPAVAINNLNGFQLGKQADDFEALYNQASFQQDTFQALHLLKGLDPKTYQPSGGAVYPNQPLGNSLRQLAQLIKADVGVEVAFADVGGWDHHVNEGAIQGQLANSLRGFAEAINAFWTDLGDRQQDVVVVTMSEFGRTVHENGNRGTDHGHANVMFVLGGEVQGGKVYGRWPGMNPGQLYQDRDLAITTDFRDVLSEAVQRHLGVTQLGGVFPNFQSDPRNFKNFLKA